MSGFVGAFAVLATGCVAVAGVHLLHRTTTVEPRPVRTGPFLCGHRPSEHAVSRFHARWYALSLLFLAFDVEMLFMYPWAIVVAHVGVKAAVEMFGFLAVLMAAVVYAWREGALRWA